MAHRVSEDEVKKLITTSRTDISPFIEAANLIVTERLGSNTSISGTLKKEIERWLAAHFVAVADREDVTEEQIGDAKVKYGGKATGEGLKSTRFGQQALALDATGTLASLGRVSTGIQVIKPNE
jgi:hypothetical protein